MDYLGNLAARAWARTPPMVRPNLEPYVPPAGPETDEEVIEAGSVPRRERAELVAAESAPREEEAVTPPEERRAARVSELAVDTEKPQPPESERDTEEDAPLVTGEVVERREQTAAAERREKNPEAPLERGELRRTLVTEMRRARRESAQTANAAHAQEAPIVHVHIGRIEVRAANQPATAPKPPARPQVEPMNLDRYLRARRNGRG